MEGIQEGKTSKDVSIEVESMVTWLGTRISGFCGFRMSQEEPQKLNKIFRNRMTALSVKDPIQFFQLVEPQSGEGLAERGQLLARTVGALHAKIFPDSIIFNDHKRFEPCLTGKSVGI